MQQYVDPDVDELLLLLLLRCDAGGRLEERELVTAR